MQKSEYVLTRTEEEAQRLRDQAHLLESYTHAILTQVGLRAGMSCLDDAAQVWGLLTPLRDVKDYLATTYRSIVPMVIKLGIATQEETELHINGLEQAIDSQPYYLGSLLVAVYKQKR